ncbi:MAG: hypothetical protein RQ833_06175 [Sphingomonadaceae bacterium]|nr:hypothetical protein [Sphingomonadaceae bacterium]
MKSALACVAAALLLHACAPSPLYVGNVRARITGDVPRDNRGEPIWDEMTPTRRRTAAYGSGAPPAPPVAPAAPGQVGGTAAPPVALAEPPNSAPLPGGIIADTPSSPMQPRAYRPHGRARAPLLATIPRDSRGEPVWALLGSTPPLPAPAPAVAMKVESAAAPSPETMARLSALVAPR